MADDRRRLSAERFCAVRGWMRERGREKAIIAAAHREHAELLAPAPMHLFISRPEWVLDEPIDLDLVGVDLVEQTPPVPEQRYEPLRAYWPLDPDGKPLARYHEAVNQCDRPARNWFNATSYRLLGVERRADGGFTLRVGTTTYWDGYDSWAALQYEAALRLREKPDQSITGPYRRSLGEPFDLGNRDCAFGISVLIVYRTAKGCFCYLQRRDPAGVATMGDMAGLIPAGEFQPSSRAHAAVRADADIWRCIMREFAEEFLGRPDVGETRAALIDYERESPFRELQRARWAGRIRPYVLDLGFDPVTWKAGMRIACVVEEDAYLEIFPDMVELTIEGGLEVPSLHRAAGEPIGGMPFDEATVRRYLDDPTITEAARLCIGLTWKHRVKLGLAEPADD